MQKERGEIGSLPPRLCRGVAEGLRFESQLGSGSSDGVRLRFHAVAPAGLTSPPRDAPVVPANERGLVYGPIEFPTMHKVWAQGTFSQVAPGDRRMQRFHPRGLR